MNTNNTILMDREMIVRVVNTLKKMDVRGYDSMNNLVALVLAFEGALNQPPETPAQED